MSKSGRRTTHLSFIKNNFSKMIQVSKQKYCSSQVFLCEFYQKFGSFLQTFVWPLGNSETCSHWSTSQGLAKLQIFTTSMLKMSATPTCSTGFLVFLSANSAVSFRRKMQRPRLPIVLGIKIPPQQKTGGQNLQSPKRGGQWLHRSAIWS